MERKRPSQHESTQQQLRNQIERTMDEIGVPEEGRHILRAVSRLPQKPPVQLSEGFKEKLLVKILEIPLQAPERGTPPTSPQK